MAKSYLLPCHDCKRMEYCRKCVVISRQVLFGQIKNPKCDDYEEDVELEYKNGVHRRKE